MLFILRKVNSILYFVFNLEMKVRYSFYSKLYNIPKSFFRGRDTKAYGKGAFIIKADSYCGERCGFQVAEGYSIQIGSNVSISHNVRIYTETNDSSSFIDGVSSSRIRADVIIENNVWIGANVFIVPGVNIGANTVIGANSIVTKNIPAGVVAGGCPAKILKVGILNEK